MPTPHSTPAHRDVNQPPTQDIGDPGTVQIEIQADGATVWVHVDGVTALRASRVGLVIVTDHRSAHRCENYAVPLFGPSGKFGPDTTWSCDECGRSLS